MKQASWVMLLALAMLSMPHASAQARDLPVQGGGGGGYFRSDCSGDYVVGIYAKAGAWIDAIGLKCAAVDRAQRTFKHPPWNKPYHGGSNGAEKTVLCPFGSHVSGIKFGHTRDGSTPKFVDYAELTCRSIANGNVSKVCLDTGNGCWDSHPREPGFGALFFTAGPIEQSCSANEAAIGIHGRSGAYVDALGLICGSKPVLVASPPPPSAGGFTKPPIRQLGKRKVRVTANNDVDIHSGPGGQFKIVGMMRRGTAAVMLERHPDGWLRLDLSVPGGAGWVAADHLTVR